MLFRSIGDVLRPKDPKDADGGSFLRLKIFIDLSLPLCRGCLVTLENDKQVWVSFKYERLPNVCYWCGRLTHVDKDCDIWIERKGTLWVEERQFGPSICAPAFVPSRENVIMVPGFYTEKKKAGPSSPSPKAVAQPTGNTTVLEGLGGCNGKEGGETQAEEVQGLVGNGNSALNSNNLGLEVTHGIHNMINQEIMSESVTTVQLETQLRGSNVELAKSDQHDFLSFNSHDSDSCAPTFLSVQSQKNEARDSHDVARVPKTAAPLRVLLKWSR